MIKHLSIQWNGDHWRIFAKDGTYFELGKTSDSQQKTASGVYEWDLDKILAPFNSTSQVKTMFIKYHQDSPDGGTTIRDAGIKQIQYGYVTSNTATSLSLIAGTVDFHYHAPNNSSTKDGLGNLYAVAYGTNYNCASSPPSSTTLRCDNPTQSGSVAAPSVMSTMTLDSITSYIGADSANQPAYRYDFAYQDTPFTTNYTDPISKTQETASGEHLLIQITPTIYTQGAPDTRKSLVLGYTGPLWDCTYNLYDEGAPSGMPSPAAGLLTKAQTYTSSDCSAQTTPLTRDYTGYDQYGNVVATADSVAIANKPIYASVGCTLATGPVYMPSSWPNTRYTTCTTYDTTHTANLPVTQANALGQTTSTSYDYTSGAVPSSVTDANGQVTSFGISYSGSNETINLSQPGETGSYNYQAK